jgi:hypothetical protein
LVLEEPLQSAECRLLCFDEEEASHDFGSNPTKSKKRLFIQEVRAVTGPRFAPVAALEERQIQLRKIASNFLQSWISPR